LRCPRIVANVEVESHGQPCQRLMRCQSSLEERGESGQWPYISAIKEIEVSVE